MSKTKKKYCTSFKEKAVKLSHVRGSVKEISEELNIPYSVIVFQVKESQNSQMNSHK